MWEFFSNFVFFAFDLIILDCKFLSHFRICIQTIFSKCACSDQLQQCCSVESTINTRRPSQLLSLSTTSTARICVPNTGETFLSRNFRNWSLLPASAFFNVKSQYNVSVIASVVQNLKFIYRSDQSCD